MVYCRCKIISLQFAENNVKNQLMSTINGTNQNDTLIGTREADRIEGLNGNDSLYGLGGDDQLDGSNGNDILRGGTGNDKLLGRNGNDHLYAGKGRDTLTGGNGDDIFVLNKDTGSSSLAEADLITDFGRGKDLIGLKSGLTFDNLNIATGTGADARDTVITDKSTSSVLAVLQGVNSSTIDSSDFISAPPPVRGYTFTKIADTSGQFQFFDTPPAINAQGTVVFQARLDNGSAGIFTGSGGATTTIVDTNGSFAGFPSTEPEINNEGTVVFAAFPDQGGVGLFSNSGGRTTTIVPASDYGFQDVDINNKGAIAFSGALEGGGISSLYFVNNGQTTKIAGTNAPISNIEGSPIDNVYNLDLNDAGDVIFRSGLNDIGTFTIINGVASKITNINGGGIAINDEGTVVFDNGGDNIVRNSNGVTTSLVDSSGRFNSVQSPVINNNDTTVFAGRLDTYTDPYGYGIFAGSDPVNDKVIATGDTLDGLTVQATGAILSDNGLNNLDQIAFSVRFTNGTQAIYRADPVTLGQGVGTSAIPFGNDTNIYSNGMMQDLNSTIPLA